MLTLWDFAVSCMVPREEAPTSLVNDVIVFALHNPLPHRKKVGNRLCHVDAYASVAGQDTPKLGNVLVIYTEAPCRMP